MITKLSPFQKTNISFEAQKSLLRVNYNKTVKVKKC